MKGLKLTIIAIFVVGFAFSLVYKRTAQSQIKDNAQLPSRQERFKHNGVIDPEISVSSGRADAVQNIQNGPTEAPVGFDGRTNGFDPQGPAFDTIEEDNVVPLRSMNDNRFIFEEAETIEDGLGPTYNPQSCRECHQNVVTGGASQIAEHRTGRTDNGAFFESLGGSLIQSRATHQNIVERVFFEDDIRTFRISTNTLGNGFLEAVANSTIQEIRDRQPSSMRGSLLTVPVFEGNGNGRLGRFGWKNQHASLQSFATDAYLNEMGITTPTLDEENLSSGRFVGFGSGFDPLPEPEDDGIDVIAFANFMRSTKAPSRGPINASVIAGDRLFREVGCNICHVTSITTAPRGTVINAGAMTVPSALGNKIIHPYTDLLLHDIGTGDGVPFLPTPEFAFTANLIRTAPLWALRTRNRLMHDGLSFTLQEAILRHGGQATSVTNAYNQLTTTQKDQLIAFLNSL